MIPCDRTVFINFIFNFVSLKSLPWVGILVALSWGFYNLVEKRLMLILILDF